MTQSLDLVKCNQKHKEDLKRQTGVRGLLPKVMCITNFKGLFSVFLWKAPGSWSTQSVPDRRRRLNYTGEPRNSSSAKAAWTPDARTRHCKSPQEQSTGLVLPRPPNGVVYYKFDMRWNEWEGTYRSLNFQSKYGTRFVGQKKHSCFKWTHQWTLCWDF